MNQPETCGQGLAQRSAVPAKLGALSAAMAENLEKHQNLTADRYPAGVDEQEITKAWRGRPAEAPSSSPEC